MDEDLIDAREQIDILAYDLNRALELLNEIVMHFHERGHPGRECIRSEWVPVERFNRWRQIIRDLET